MAKDEARPAVVSRLNVALIGQALAALEELLKRNPGLQKVDLINRAITLYDFIDSELASGNQVMILAPDGTTQLVKLL